MMTEHSGSNSQSRVGHLVRLRRSKVTTKDDGEPWYPGDQRGRDRQLGKAAQANGANPTGIFGIKSSRRHRHQINPNCDLVHTHLPPSGTDHTGRGGASYDRTSEAHARVVNDRPACDRRIASDYLDLGLDWSLATNLSRPSARPSRIWLAQNVSRSWFRHAWRNQMERRAADRRNSVISIGSEPARLVVASAGDLCRRGDR